MRTRAQRKATKAALSAITQEQMAIRQLRMAATYLNSLVGPDKTAAQLYLLRHHFATPGGFRDAADQHWKENQ